MGYAIPTVFWPSTATHLGPQGSLANFARKRLNLCFGFGTKATQKGFTQKYPTSGLTASTVSISDPLTVVSNLLTTLLDQESIPGVWLEMWI